MIFRFYHETLGGHVHIRLFAGKKEGALGKCGDLTMRVEEFKEFKEELILQAQIEFVKEDRSFHGHDR
jgi:hypothetical protein